MRKENIGKKKEVIDTLYKFRKILVIRLDKQNTKPMPADAYLMLMNQNLIIDTLAYMVDHLIEDKKSFPGNKKKRNK